MNPSNRLTGAVPTGEKNSVVTHRNIPPNSVLLPGQRGGEGKGPPFFLPSRGSVSGVTTGVRKKKRVKREEKRKDR